MLTRTATIVACITGCMTCHTFAGGVTFGMIPDARSANDMSPDGRFIVGKAVGERAYLLDTFTQQMRILPPECMEAMAVSDDGRTVLGSILVDFGGGQFADVAAIWTEASDQWTSLGYLPNAGFCPSRSSGYELSADGSVAVGLSWVGCSGRGFRWTSATGMVELQSLANGSNRASVVSSDGNIIGGFAQGSFSRTPAMWGGSGAGVLLDPPSGDALGEIHGMNDAGSLLLADWNGKATAVTNGGTVRTLIGNGSLLPGWTGIPQDVANTGTVVGFDILTVNRRAWIQVGGTGPLVDLRAYCVGHGADVPSNVALEVPQAITVDGTLIIGHGGSGAWFVRLPGGNACTGDIAPSGGNGVVDGADLGALLAAWGTPAGDLDGDGATNGADLGALLSAWGACPPPTGACCVDGECTQASAAECAQRGGSYLGNDAPCSATSCVHNDLCIDAIDITGNINGDIVEGDNSTATPSLYSDGDPELPTGSPSCQWFETPAAVHATVWYSFVAPASGTIIADTCSSSPVPFFDSLIALYAGTCGALVEVGCDEDGCADAMYYSRLHATGLTPGQVYYLCVMNPGSWLGSVPGVFQLRITTDGVGGASSPPPGTPHD